VPGTYLKAALVLLIFVTFRILLDASFSCNQSERNVGNNIKEEEHELVEANERVIWLFLRISDPKTTGDFQTGFGAPALLA